MALVASTKTFRSSNLTTLSIMPAAFSKLMEYWKPEHPPPTTPMRRPAGTGSWVAIISLTLVMAAGVRTTGAPVLGASTTSAPLTTSALGVTLAVAINPSPDVGDPCPAVYFKSIWQKRKQQPDRI